MKCHKESLFVLPIHGRVGWLEPLLHRIGENPHNVVCPVIDTIDLETLSYNGSPYAPIYVGKFNWELTFDWMPMQKQVAANRNSSIDPIRLVNADSCRPLVVCAVCTGSGEDGESRGNQLWC